MSISIIIAQEEHFKYAQIICDTIESSALLRGTGIAKRTTGLAVMKINSELGYKPVPFSELTTDPSFWKGCQTCTNYEILKSKENKMCLCTGMLFDPKEKQKIPPKHPFNVRIWNRLKKIKQALFLED